MTKSNDNNIINNNNNNNQYNHDDDLIFMGIFYGHGFDGHAVSHYIAQELPNKIIAFLELTSNENNNLTQAIINIFNHLNQNQPIQSGSCSTCCLFIKINENRFMASSVPIRLIKHLMSTTHNSKLIKFEYFEI